MSHDISVSFGRAHMAYSGRVPWHQLGIKVDENATPSEAAVAAGLDWRAICIPRIINTTEKCHMNTGDLNLIREDVWKAGRHAEAVIGRVPNDYVPVQNAEVISVLDTMAQNPGIHFETAGTLGKGEKSWFMVKLSGGVEIAKNDPVEMYLVLVNRFDRQSVEARLTPVRVVCANTLSFSVLRGLSAEIPHEMATTEGMLQTAIDFDHIRKESQDLYTLFRKMANTSINAEQLNAMAAATFPTPRSGKNKLDLDFEASRARSQSIVYSKSGIGNTTPEVAGTVWSALNGITEYLDHRQSRRNSYSPEQRLESIWFGDGYHAKLRAMEFAKRLVNQAAGRSIYDDVGGVKECSRDQDLLYALV